MSRHLAILTTLLLLTLFALSVTPASPNPNTALTGDNGSILEPNG